MKTLEIIKREYARERGFIGILEMEYDGMIGARDVDEVAKRYAKEVAREALKNASENAIMKYHCGHFKTDTPTQYHQQGADNIQIDKKSIINERNIPEP